MRRVVVLFVVSLMLVSLGTVAVAQGPEVRQFDVLLRSIPFGERDAATLKVPRGDALVVMRPGNGLFECIGDTPGDARFSVMCYHRSLQHFLAYTRMLADQGLLGEAFRERLCAAVERGVITAPRRALVLTAGANIEPDGSLPDSITVYHLLQLPNATATETGLPQVAHRPNAPYLHNGGSCDAHVMWSHRESIGIDAAPSPE